jgi:hypothetical protein
MLGKFIKNVHGFLYLCLGNRFQGLDIQRRHEMGGIVKDYKIAVVNYHLGN